MTATLDVYEELRRRVGASRDMVDLEPKYAWAATAFERALELIEFLRWRSALEEWPADGCECVCVFEWAPPGSGYYCDSTFQMDRETVTRWRYILGPCQCAQPKGGEG